MLGSFDIVSVGVKYLVFVSEVEEFLSLFGITERHFREVVFFVMETIVQQLIDKKLARVFWDIGDEVLEIHKERKK